LGKKVVCFAAKSGQGEKMATGCVKEQCRETNMKGMCVYINPFLSELVAIFIFRYDPYT